MQTHPLLYLITDNKPNRHRKPIEVLEMCYSGRLICSMLELIPQSGDFSGAALGVRSVALLQVT